MNQKKFETDESAQFVLEPRSKLQLSELEESDFKENTDVATEVIPRILEVEEEIEEE